MTLYILLSKLKTIWTGIYKSKGMFKAPYSNALCCEREAGLGEDFIEAGKVCVLKGN